MIFCTFIALALAQQHQPHARSPYGQQQNPWTQAYQMGMIDLDFSSDAMQNMYDYHRYSNMFQPHGRQGQGQQGQQRQGGFNPMMYAMAMGNGGDFFEQMADTAQDLAEMRMMNRLINPQGPAHGHRHSGVVNPSHHLMKAHAQPAHGAQQGQRRGAGGLGNLFNAYMMDYEGMETEDWAQAVAMGANPRNLPPSENAMDMIDNVVDYAMDTPYWAYASNLFGGRHGQQGHGKGHGQQPQQQAQNPWQSMFQYPGWWMGELSKPRPAAKKE